MFINIKIQIIEFLYCSEQETEPIISVLNFKMTLIVGILEFITSTNVRD